MCGNHLHGLPSGPCGLLRYCELESTKYKVRLRIGRLRWLELLDWDYTVLDLLHPMQKVQLIVLLCLLAAVVVDSSFLFPRAAHADDACQAVQTPIAKAGTSIVLIGNPGCGKSTLLNTLAGKPLFESGIRYQAGWSLQLQLVHFPVLINP